MLQKDSEKLIKVGDNVPIVAYDATTGFVNGGTLSL